MSKGDVAAFLHRLALDKKLREELTTVAGTRGFVFTSDELAEADFEGMCGRMVEAASEMPDALDDGEIDPGFGIIEVPA
jgi:hypothetical protein